MLFAVIQDGFALAGVDVVLVLHAYDVDEFADLLDLRDGNLTQAHETDLALRLQLLDRRKRLLDRHLRVDAVQLPEVQLVGLEMPETHLDLLLQVLRTAHDGPTIGAGPYKPRLGRNHQALLVGSQRLADQDLVHVGAVAVSGIDEVDSELHGPAQHLLGCLTVLGLSPDTVARQAHPTKAKAMDLKRAAELKGGTDCCCVRHKFSSSHWMASREAATQRKTPPPAGWLPPCSKAKGLEPSNENRPARPRSDGAPHPQHPATQYPAGRSCPAPVWPRRCSSPAPAQDCRRRAPGSRCRPESR